MPDKMPGNKSRTMLGEEKGAFAEDGNILDVHTGIMTAKVNKPLPQASAHTKDVPTGQSDFLILLQMLLDLAQRVLRDMFIRHIGKLKCEVGEFLKNNKSELLRLKRKKVLTFKEYSLLFPDQHSLLDVQRLNTSILCKLLLNLSCFKLSQNEKKGVKAVHSARRWIISRPRAVVEGDVFTKKWQQLRLALNLIGDRFCNEGEETGLLENILVDDRTANVFIFLMNDGTEVLRRVFLHRTNHHPALTLGTHRSRIEMLLRKRTLNEERWKEALSPSGTLDLAQASCSQLCTLLQTVCGDLPPLLTAAIRHFQELRMRILHHGNGAFTDAECNGYQHELQTCIQELEESGRHGASVNTTPIPVEEVASQERLARENNNKDKDVKEVLATCSDTSEFVDEDLDLGSYFERKAKCGSSVPLESSEPIRMQGRLHMAERDASARDNDRVRTEKRRIMNMLSTSSNAEISNQLHLSRKSGKFIANVVCMPKQMTTESETGLSEKSHSTNNVGIEYELGEQVTENVPREIKYLPSDGLPWPQLSMDLVVAYVQHDTLDSIFSMMTSPSPPGPQITMKYEILRLCTYRNFPEGDQPYLIRLAAAGFYYAGEDDEVTCYCCGQRKSGWTSAEVPVNVHSMLSPGCVFFTKNLEVNVPVPHPVDTRPNGRQIGDVQQENGACGHTAVASTALAVADVKNNPTSISSNQLHRTALKNTERRRPIGNMAFQTTSHPLQQNHSTDANAPVNNYQPLPQQAGLGIDFERPKHPQYAVKAVRLQSFDNWPRNIRQTPQELAEAGMYYAGFGDCVRCFFCGIGLRHWSEEDNPWIEHARWSPRCVFLRQVKGDEFVDLVQLAVQYSNEEDEDIPGHLTASNSSPNELVVRQQPPKTDAPNYLLTDAAQSVLEMGYQPRMVQKAIDFVLRQKGREHLTATSIMEHVLELEEAEATAKLQKNMESMNLNTSDSNVNKSMDDDKVRLDTKKILKQNKELKDQTMCKVCLDNPVCIVFLPCGHLVTCAECAPAMRKCPICRAIVKGTVKTYMV